MLKILFVCSLLTLSASSFAAEVADPSGSCVNIVSVGECRQNANEYRLDVVYETHSAGVCWAVPEGVRNTVTLGAATQEECLQLKAKAASRVVVSSNL